MHRKNTTRKREYVHTGWLSIISVRSTARTRWSIICINVVGSGWMFIGGSCADSVQANVSYAWRLVVPGVLPVCDRAGTNYMGAGPKLLLLKVKYRTKQRQVREGRRLLISLPATIYITSIHLNLGSASGVAREDLGSTSATDSHKFNRYV